MPFSRDDRGAAELGDVSLGELLEGRGPASAGVRTPAYVYDLDAMVAEARALQAGFGGAPSLVAYAVKANTAGPILRALFGAGCAAEVVSGAELAVALACGVSPGRILFSGVAKTDAELDRAMGAASGGILSIQVESVEEIARIEARARATGRTARISFRVNPSVVADTHAHVATGHDEAKFGIALEDLPDAYAALEASRGVKLVGLSSHIGSQLTRTAEYLASAERLLGLAADRERSHGALQLVDFGGGFGIDYGAGCPVAPADFARELAALVGRSPLAGRTIVVEPGRALVGAHGVLCARVIMAKRSKSGGGRRWLLIDAGMNDLLRPALYAAAHRIEPVDRRPPAEGEGELWRVAGPVCESSDDFGERRFEEAPRAVVIRDAGAYGYTMASEYNGRGLPAEIFLSGGRVVATHEPRSPDAWAAERARIGRGRS